MSGEPASGRFRVNQAFLAEAPAAHEAVTAHKNAAAFALSPPQRSGSSVDSQEIASQARELGPALR